MKNIFFKITGIGICLVALALNLQHAFDGYGVKKTVFTSIVAEILQVGTLQVVMEKQNLNKVFSQL